MRGPSAFPDEQISLPLHVEREQAAFAHNVPSRSSTRLLWTGLGFAALMLIGVSACALHPIGRHASAEPSGLAPGLAFSHPPALGRISGNLKRPFRQPLSMAAKPVGSNGPTDNEEDPFSFIPDPKEREEARERYAMLRRAKDAQELKRHRSQLEDMWTQTIDNETDPAADIPDTKYPYTEKARQRHRAAAASPHPELQRLKREEQRLKMQAEQRKRTVKWAQAQAQAAKNAADGVNPAERTVDSQLEKREPAMAAKPVGSTGQIDGEKGPFDFIRDPIQREKALQLHSDELQMFTAAQVLQRDRAKLDRMWARGDGFSMEAFPWPDKAPDGSNLGQWNDQLAAVLYDTFAERLWTQADVLNLLSSVSQAALAGNADAKHSVQKLAGISRQMDWLAVASKKGVLPPKQLEIETRVLRKKILIWAQSAQM